MDLQAKLQELVNTHNTLLEQEQATRDERIQVLGRIQAVKEILDESLKEESILLGSTNGHDPDADLHLVPDTSES